MADQRFENDIVLMAFHVRADAKVPQKNELSVNHVEPGEHGMTGVPVAKVAVRIAVLVSNRVPEIA